MKTVYFRLTMLFFLCLISKSVDAQWWQTNFCNSAKLLWCDEPVWGEINSYSENQIVNYRIYDDYSHYHYTEVKSGKEVIYKFTPTKDGVHHFDLGYDSHYGNNNLDLFILKSCSNATYHVPVAHTKALTNWSPTDQDTVSVELQKGWTYYIVVEQMSTYHTSTATKFNLKVKCDVETKKNLCSSYVNYLTCNKQEWNYLCTNCNDRWNSYCSHYNGYTGPEAVYAFRPEVSGEYVFDLTYNTHYGNIDMFLFADCDMKHCVGNTADYGNWYKIDKDHLKVHLYAWQTYYIVLDRKSGSVTTFDLTVDCRVINCDKQPWLKEGVRVSDDVCKHCGDRWNGYCDWASTSHSGYEQVFRFRPKEDGNYLFDLDYWGGDMDIIILDECDPDECLSRSSHTNGIHNDELFIELKKNKTYIVVVDQKYASNSTEFQLQVDYKGYCEQVTVKDFPQMPFYIDEDGHYTFDLYDLKSRSEFNGAYDIAMSIDGKSIGQGTKLNANVVEGRESNLCIEWKKTIGRQDYCYSYCQEIYFPIHPTVCNSLEFVYDKSSSSPISAYTEEQAVMWIMHDDSEIMEVQRAGDIDFDANTFNMPTQYHQGSQSVSMLYRDYLGRLRICSKTICTDDYTDNGSTINALFRGKGTNSGSETLRYQLSSNIQDKTSVLKWSWFPIDAGINRYNVTVSSDKTPIMEIPANSSSNYGVSLLYKTGNCHYVKYIEISAEDPFDVCVLDESSTCSRENVFVSNNGATCGSIGSWEATIGLPSPLSQSNILYWTDHSGNIISNSRTNTISLDQKYPLVYCHVRQSAGQAYEISSYAIMFPSCAESLACGGEITGSLEFETNDWNRQNLGLDASCVQGCQFNGVDKLYQFEYGGKDMKITMTQMPANENISLFVLNESFQAVSLNGNSNNVICKGWNVDEAGNPASGSNVVGEIFADESNPLPAGTYYILIEGGCGNGESTSYTSDFSISLECEAAIEEEPDTTTTDTVDMDTMTTDTMQTDTMTVVDTTTTMAQSTCDNFDQYDDKSGISSVSSRWGQTGSNDIQMFYGKVNGEDMRALQLVSNSAARYNLPYEHVVGISFDLWQLSGTNDDEGIYLKVTDVDNRDVFINIYTKGEYSFLTIEGDLPNKTSQSFSPQLNAGMDLKIEWNNSGFSVGLGSSTNFLNTGFTSKGIQSIEFKSGDNVGIANLIDNLCLDTTASVSRSSLSRSSKEIVIQDVQSEVTVSSNLMDINVIPNPAMEQATMVVHTLQEQEVNISLYSITGAVLARFSENLQEGQNLITLPMEKFANYEGLILYQAQTNTEKFRGKFIKLR